MSWIKCLINETPTAKRILEYMKEKYGNYTLRREKRKAQLNAEETYKSPCEVM